MRHRRCFAYRTTFAAPFCLRARSFDIAAMIVCARLVSSVSVCDMSTAKVAAILPRAEHSTSQARQPAMLSTTRPENKALVQCVAREEVRLGDKHASFVCADMYAVASAMAERLGYVMRSSSTLQPATTDAIDSEHQNATVAAGVYEFARPPKSGVEPHYVTCANRVWAQVAPSQIAIKIKPTRSSHVAPVRRAVQLATLLAETRCPHVVETYFALLNERATSWHLAIEVMELGQMVRPTEIGSI